MSEIVVACACCGLPGTLVGDEAGMRCVRHEYVVDAQEWLRVRSEMTSAFATEAALMSYFLRDYGAGLEIMQALQAAASKDSSDADETLH